MNITVYIYTDCSVAVRSNAHFQYLPSGDVLFLLTDGSNEDFSHGYQPIMDLIKDCVPRVFSQNGGVVEDGLSSTFDAVKEELARQFPPGDGYTEVSYTATYIAMVLSGNECFSAWVGSHQARLYRRGSCVNHTNPHVLIHQKKDGDVVFLTHNVISTGSGENKGYLDLAGPWQLLSQDTLVIADCRLFALGSDEDIVALICADSPSPARSLVEWAQRLQPDFARGVLVIRLWD